MMLPRFTVAIILASLLSVVISAVPECYTLSDDVTETCDSFKQELQMNPTSSQIPNGRRVYKITDDQNRGCTLEISNQAFPGSSYSVASDGTSVTCSVASGSSGVLFDLGFSPYGDYDPASQLTAELTVYNQTALDLGHTEALCHSQQTLALANEDPSVDIFFNNQYMDFSLFSAALPSSRQCHDYPVYPNVRATDTCGQPRIDSNGQVDEHQTYIPPVSHFVGKISRSVAVIGGHDETKTFDWSFELVDTVPPSIHGVPDAVHNECDVVLPPCEDVTTTDNCDVNPQLSVSEHRNDVMQAPTPTCPSNYDLIYTWTATDHVELSSSRTQTVHVRDTTPPEMFGLPPAITTAECDAIPRFQPQAKDNCDNDIVVETTDWKENIACEHAYTHEFRYRACDDCGNCAEAEARLVVTDTTSPVISAVDDNLFIPAHLTPEPCTPVVTDNCDDDPSLVRTVTRESLSDCPHHELITYTWTATDACGNIDVQTQTIEVNDLEPPIMTEVPETLTADCGSIPEYTVTATDEVDGALQVTYTEEEVFDDGTGDCPHNKQLNRRWTASDLCGNTVERTQIVHVTDTNGPVFIGLPNNLESTCDTTLQLGDVTAEDDCSGLVVPDVSYEDERSCPHSYVRTWTWRAEDECGHLSEEQRTWTIVDDEAPVIQYIPTDMHVEYPFDHETYLANLEPAPQATDLCDDAPSLSKSTSIITGDCDQQYQVLTIWTATDACGNEASGQQTIFVDDSTDPIVTWCTGSETAPCGSQAPCDIDSYTVQDNCGEDCVQVSISEPQIEIVCEHTYTKKWTLTAADQCGNDFTDTYFIQWQDIYAPDLINVPQNVIIEYSTAVPVPTVSAIDNCDDDVDVTSSTTRLPGNCPTNYVDVTTFTATDDCGLSTSTNWTVTAIDTTDPTLDVPEDSSVGCDAWNIDLIKDNLEGQATCFDDGGCTITFSDAVHTGPDSCTISYLTRTWTACDCSNNCVTKVTKVYQVDVDAPTFSSWQLIDAREPWLEAGTYHTSFNCENPSFQIWASYDDDCDSDVPSFAVYEGEQSDESCNPGYLYSVTGTDDCGRTSTPQQIIANRIDDEPPIISVSPSTISSNDCIPEDPISVSYSDACGNVGYTQSGDWVWGPNQCSGQKVVTYLATDECGLTASATATYTFTDTTAPAFSQDTLTLINQQKQETLGASYQCASDVPDALAILEGSDCNTDVSVTPSRQSGVDDQGNEGFWFSYTITDLCENSNEIRWFVAVEDTQPPTTAEPVDVHFQCYDSEFSADAIDALDWEDNCSASEDLVIKTTVSADVVSSGCHYIFTITQTAEDENGNIGTKTWTITFLDTESPDIDAGTDNCQYIFDGCTESHFGICYPDEFSTETICTARDACGNTDYSYMIEDTFDNIAPVLTATPAISSGVSYACYTDASNHQLPTVTSDYLNASFPISYTSTESLGSSQCRAGNIHHRWYQSDCAGNEDALTMDIGIVPDVTITLPPSSETFECGASASDWPLPNPTWSDVTFSGSQCSDYAAGSISTVSVPPLIDFLNYGHTYSYGFKATHPCGDEDTATHTIEIVDTLDPTPTHLSIDEVFECDSGIADHIDSWSPSATDQCDADLTKEHQDDKDEGNCPCHYDLTRTWTFTDDAGNSATSEEIFSVRDTIKPVFQAPLPQDVSVNAPDSIPYATDLTACDAGEFHRLEANAAGKYCWTVEGQVHTGANSKFTQTQQQTGPYTTVFTRTWTAMDSCGNEVSHVQIINYNTQPTGPGDVRFPDDESWECGEYVVIPTEQENINFILSTATTSGITVSATSTLINHPEDCNDYSIRRDFLVYWNGDLHQTGTTTYRVEDTVAPTIEHINQYLTDECEAIHDDPIFSDCNSFVADYVDNCAVLNGETCALYHRVWTVTDACGHETGVTQYITVEDTTPPHWSSNMVLPPTNIELDCKDDYTGFERNFDATDNCDDVTPVYDESEWHCCGCSCTKTITVTATDLSGNSITFTQTVSADDTVDPILTNKPDFDSELGMGLATIECNEDWPELPTPSADDNCGLDHEATTTYISYPDGDRLATFTFYDWCGNSVSYQHKTTTVDTTAPSITIEDEEFDCALPSHILTYARSKATVTDNCDDPTLEAVITVDPVGDCEESTTIALSATDSYGNVGYATVVYTSNELSAPTISWDLNQYYECGVDTVPQGIASADDDCHHSRDLQLTESRETVPGGDHPNAISTTTFVWTANDCSSTATETDSTQVLDTRAPDLIMHSITQDCASQLPIPYPTSTDSCTSPTLTKTSENTDAECTLDGYVHTTTQSWEASDNFHTTSGSRTITLTDTAAPQFDLSDILTHFAAQGWNVGECNATFCFVSTECEWPSTAYTPTATDNCHTASISETSASLGASHKIVTYTVSDGCLADYFTISFELRDTSAPTFAPQDLNLDCSDSLPLQSPDQSGLNFVAAFENTEAFATYKSEVLASASDCNLGALSWIASTDATCSSTVITYEWTICDTYGQCSTASSRVRISSHGDYEWTSPYDPILSFPCDGDVVIPTQTLDHACLPSITIHPDLSGGSSDLPELATWNHGLDTLYGGTCTPDNRVSDIDYYDHGPPIVDDIDDITVECQYNPNEDPYRREITEAQILSLLEAASHDSCDSDLDITITSYSDTTNCDRIIHVTHQVTDDTGNSNSGDMTITITDSSGPILYYSNDENKEEITSLEDAEVECHAVPGPLDISGWDDCDGDLTPALQQNVEDIEGEEAYWLTYTWTVEDGCGNEKELSWRIKVKDETNPEWSNFPEDCSGDCDECEHQPPVAIDLCDSAVTVTSTQTSTQVGDCKDYVVQTTYTATDDAGNSISRVHTTTVIDDKAPVFNIQFDSEHDCSEDLHDISGTALDECDGAVEWSMSIVYGETNKDFQESATITLTATDACGQSSTLLLFPTWSDTTPPTLTTGPAERSFEVQDLTLPLFQPVTVNDDCDDDPVDECTSTINKQFCAHNFTVTRICEATDDSGNTDSSTEIVHVFDVTPPSFVNLPSPLTILQDPPVYPEYTGGVSAVDNSGYEYLVVNVEDSLNAEATATQYVITRTFTVTDLCGNTNVATVIIRVEDTKPPVLCVTPEDKTLECGTLVEECPNCLQGPDAVSTSLTFLENQNLANGVGTIQRSWYGHDSQLNSVTHSQTITFIDSTAPVIESSFDHPLNEFLVDECPCDTPPAILLSSTDACTPDTITEISSSGQISFADFSSLASLKNSADYSAYTAAGGPTLTMDQFNDWVAIKWDALEACDAHGNCDSSIALRAYTDDTAPLLSIGDELLTRSFECKADAIAAGLTDPIASDSCVFSEPELSTEISTDADLCSGAHSKTSTLTDSKGNFATVTVQNTYDDTESPHSYETPDACVFPPNNAMIRFNFEELFDVADNCQTLDIKLTGCSTNGAPSNSFRSDCALIAGSNKDLNVQAVAGQTYTVFAEASDGCNAPIHLTKQITVYADGASMRNDGAWCKAS